MSKIIAGNSSSHIGRVSANDLLEDTVGCTCKRNNLQLSEEDRVSTVINQMLIRMHTYVNK